ncbi:MAG: Chromosome partition protein Smc [Syntrophorhabdus sp. PtaU1.Bin002]|nr:MAG: Chromosome partition protein Smc [Syntrophorhabdus sp. PtaU1.Bin002]
MQRLSVVILAAGKGERMVSKKPKVMHEIMGKPMVSYVIRRAKELLPTKIVVVLGHGRELVEGYVKEFGVECAVQAEQKGTAHALLMAEELIQGDDVLVLYGDVPLIEGSTLDGLLSFYEKARAVVFMTTEVENPFGYGRVIVEGDRIERIVEEVDATPEEKERRGESEKILAGIDTEGVLAAKKDTEETFLAREKELEEMRALLVRLRTDVLLLGREQKELEPIVPKAEPGEGEDERLSPQDIETRLADAQRRIAELGPVNEYAAIQYDEEKGELDRLKAQHLDVVNAAQSLEGIIKEINTQARSRYEQAFVAVREEFRRTFTFFFPGGEADLKLENPDDPFNSAIQITARPEGKQLKRLAQLSDGERTMLGISLLFAFYAVKPAPFLFVDELDAPLDDNNVLKLASFLARVKDRIQIFVITHNKRTMEKADTIYGVTMEEPGVSKIISVRLKDVKRQHVAVEET